MGAARQASSGARAPSASLIGRGTLRCGWADVRSAGHATPAAEAIKDPAFRAEFNAIKNSFLRWSVAFIEIENDLELYLLEAFCAMELDTGFDAGGWNTFATH